MIDDEFSPEEIAMMSPEERRVLVEDREDLAAGTEASEERAPEAENVTAPAGEQQQPATVPTPMAESTPPAEQPVSETTPAETASSEFETKQPAPVSEELAERMLPPFVPMQTVTRPADEIRTQLKQLQDSYLAGDLDPVEYDNQKDVLKDELRAIDFNAAMQNQLWRHEQTIFYEHNPQFRPGEAGNPVLYGALKHVFEQLDRDPENASKTGYQLLNQAKKMVLDQLTKVDVRGGDGGTRTGGEPAKESGAQPTATAQAPTAPRALETTQLPKTLGGVPIAQPADTGQDEFSSLDKLSGEEFERAISKLNPDQERRYLQRMS